MALIKKIPHPETGAIASYWKRIAISESNGVTRIVMGGWLNREAYQNGLKPIMEITKEEPAGQSPELLAAVDSFAINRAKTWDEFQGAIEAG